MSKSPYKPRRAASLKAATSELVTLVGGQPAAAELLGVSKNTVFRWTDDSDDNAGRFIPAQAVRVLERAAGEPLVTRFLAAEQGAVLLRLDRVVLDADMGAAVARYATETSEAFARLAQALADGRTSPNEARASMRELDQAQAVGAALRERLRIIAEEGEHA